VINRRILYFSHCPLRSRGAELKNVIRPLTFEMLCDNLW